MVTPAATVGWAGLSPPRVARGNTSVLPRLCTIRALDAAPPPPGSTQGGVHWRMHIGASKTVAEPTHSTGRPTSRQRDENAVWNVPIDLLLVWHRDPAATASG